MSDTQMGLVEFYNLHQKLGANDLILDVRRPEEFAEAHIENALNIPLDQLPTRFNELQKYSKVYIHCKRGGRAKTAFETLSQHGLKNIICIHDAGMDLWIENGYPVKR
jgi:phage shock protein E